MSNGDRLIELLNGGDWACAFSNGESLAQVCVEIAELEPDLAPHARAVIARTDTDLEDATSYWSALARLIRRREIRRRHAVV